MSLDVSLINLPCDCCGRSDDALFEANITHNLGSMASAAGIYEIVWRPDECGITFAGEIVERLSAGIAELDANRAKYEEYNAENGWGTYRQFVPWLERYRDACAEFRGAVIEVSR